MFRLLLLLLLKTIELWTLSLKVLVIIGHILNELDFQDISHGPRGAFSLPLAYVIVFVLLFF